MLWFQIQSTTAVAEAGNGMSAGIQGMVARKRFRERSGSPPRPRKKAGLDYNTSHGLLSGCSGLQPIPSTAIPSSSSSCPSSALHGAILSPPYQPWDNLPVTHETSCFGQTSVPTPDTVNAGAALGTPPSEEKLLQERYQPIIPYDTGSFPVIDGPLPSDASTVAPPVWSNAIDQLPFPSWDDAHVQDPNVEAVSSYTADLIALGHSNASPTATYSPGLTPDTLSGYQNFPATPLSGHSLQLRSSQPAYYDVLSQTGFEATPEVTVSGLNFGLPLYQSPVFGDQTASSLLQTYPGLTFDQELPFLLLQGGHNEDIIKQLSPGSASSDEEALVLKTSQSPESKAFLDDVPLKTEQRSPPQEIKKQSDPSPEPVKPIYEFPIAAQGNTDKESIKLPQKQHKNKTKLDPTTELQLVHQCFNSHGRSFALIREPLDNNNNSWGSTTKSVIGTQAQKARKPLGEDERQETSRTRDVGACVRCKIQRVRCKPNLDEPEGPCLACIKVARNRSQKRIHNIGCHRYKLQEISLFRTTRLRFTKRWQGAQIRDVPTFGEPVTIWIYQGLAKPWPITVRRYEFEKMDPRTIVARRWADPHGTCREQSDYPYALASVNETKDWYREYITENKFEAYHQVIDEDSKSQKEIVCDAIVKDVYRLAHKNHYDQLPASTKWNFYRPPEKLDVRQISEENFMAGIFEMWFAMRQSTGSSYVRFGDAKLDPADGDVRPGSSWTALSTLATPKMVVGQFNSINITCVLRPLAKVLLKVLMSWITDRHYHRWMSIFYATFIILREIAHTTHDAYIHGARNPDRDSGSQKPNWPENIVELHESANIILAHWHYFNCSTDPTTLSEKARGKSPLRELNDEQLQTVQGIWSRVHSWKSRKNEASSSWEMDSDTWYEQQWPAWCEPLYFAGQMFDVDWRPLPIFHG